MFFWFGNEMNSKTNSKNKKMNTNIIQANTNNIGGGNTNSPPKSVRKCCFTLNNPSNTRIQDIIEKCQLRGYLYCIGEEVGDKGTPHLQGYIEFPAPKKWTTVQNLFNKKAHIEKAKGTRKQNLTYCKKDGKFHSNFPVPLKEQILAKYEDVEWYDWQKKIIALHDEPAGDRKIVWVTDYVGNRGKSFLTRYMVVKFNIILADGKKADVFHQIAKRLEDVDNEDVFDMVILDIPRHNQEFINYGLLEQLKNGCIMSGKFEGGVFVFPSPHVIVMSNELPDYTKFSQDRWETIIL